MEKEEIAWRSHVLVLPFSGHGHINPMFQFSKRLSSKGIKVTMAVTNFIAKSMEAKSGSIRIETFSDGFDEGGINQAGGYANYFERFEVVGSINLSKLIEEQNGTKYPIKCIIYDSLIPWALDLAKRLGLFGASFFTKSCAIDAIYYHLHHGSLIVPIQGPTVSLPGLPPLELHELPPFVRDMGWYQRMLKYFQNHFSNVDKADWVFFNTFDKLEDEVVAWMEKQRPMQTMTIGPTVPSLYLAYRAEDYDLSLFKLNLDTCMDWLNTKQTKSVVYVSFGTTANVGTEQIEELAWGLRKSNNYYLWVIKDSGENKFVEEKLEKGLVVKWCPQVEVLAHRAIGCFITHCGWNSTLEALSVGVPMVAMPQISGHNTNAKFVEDVWRVGIRTKADEKGIVRRDEIEHCVRKIMNGVLREEIKKNSEKWKELAKEAVNEGGSSDKNIEEFVARLVSTSS